MPAKTMAAAAFGLVLALASASVAGAHSPDLEPRLRLASPAPGARVVALTFDACSGAVDQRILDALVANGIKATLFVTQRWLVRNPRAMAQIMAHPDLFEIENHGEHHVPLVTDAASVYGIKTAGTIEAVRREVDAGAAAVQAATGAKPHWFRGATARYSRDAITLVTDEGYAIAGYSLNADMGASLPADAVARRLTAARTGDVVIAHINQPNRPSGAGVVAGLLALQAAGVVFVRLDEGATRGD
jgi:peptidoglycan/xylan/chitin deacetylase (PgdA/CDA1 family)